MNKTQARRHLAHHCNACTTPLAVSGLSRRSLLAGSAALAAYFSLGQHASAQAKPHRIDVHHHISPPTYLDAVKAMKLDNPPMNNWSVQKSLEDMDKAGIATAITSPTTPQVGGLGKEIAARICRESNEYAKRLETDHPGRFGTFAMLPLPHIDACLTEIAYAFDTLKVDGIGCMTSYGDKWLGYQEFGPVWEELDRRKATVYTHPTTANCCVNLMPGVNPALIEFGTDTARSIFNVIFSGTAQKYKNINWIWSHGGGALTAFAERFLIQAVSTPPYKGKITRETVEHELNRYYYDTAAISNTVTIAALAQLVPVSQIVYGTDFPYRTGEDHTKGVTAHFKGADLSAVDRDNALRLFPRFGAA
jgi:predicted TIM-barrel fold metal-dependent hydrolase